MSKRLLFSQRGLSRFGLGQFALLSCHDKLSKLGVLRKARVHSGEFHLVKTNLVKANTEDLLGG